MFSSTGSTGQLAEFGVFEALLGRVLRQVVSTCPLCVGGLASELHPLETVLEFPVHTRLFLYKLHEHG